MSLLRVTCRLSGVASLLLLAGPVLLAGLVGCGNKPATRVEVTGLNPGEAAAKAMADFDTNKDGSIAGPEFDKAPGLRAALKPKLDKNADGKLSSEEISARLQQYVDSKAAAVTCRCEVKLNGQPVEGATVKLIPESFLSGFSKPAQAVTDSTGAASAQIEGSTLPGIVPGIYRVEITKNTGGKEMFPARYNTQTTLGYEAAADLIDQISSGATFDLKP